MREIAVQDYAAIPARRILIVAPHPDDESLGCGGLIWTLARLGRRFHALFVTDGGASHPNSGDWPRPRLAAEREREAGAALAILGLSDHPRTFLRLPDADMPRPGSPAHRDALETVAALLAGFRPDLALLPWRRDPHRDHRDSWTLVMAALAPTNAPVDILEYAVWLDEIGAAADHPRPGEAERVVFDATQARDAKRSAVAAHRTQTTALIADDPTAFRLTPRTIERLTGPRETYWRPLS